MVAYRVLLVLLLAFGSGIGAVATAGPAVALPSVQVTVTSVAPDLVVAGSTVRVRGTIANTGTTTLTEIEVQLRTSVVRLGTRAEVASWWDGQSQRIVVPAGQAQELDGALPVGQRASFAVDVPAATMGLPAAEFGAYPIAVGVTATDQQSGLRGELALARASVQSQPAQKRYEAQRISWVVPFVGLPETTVEPAATPAQSADKMANLVGPNSRLSRLLDAASTPGVVWAVDPQLLLALRRVAGDDVTNGDNPGTPSTGPGAPGSDSSGPTQTRSARGPSSVSATEVSTGSLPAPSSSTTPPQQATDRLVVQDFLRRLRDEAPRHEVVALPYADPDLQALTGSRGRTLLAETRTTGAEVVEAELGLVPWTDLAWPADGSATDRLLRTLSNVGFRSVLLNADTRPLEQILDYTPDARTTTVPGGLVGAVADPGLSTLASAVSQDDASARTRLLAETAAIATERPGLPRRHVVALPRTADPDPTSFRSMVAGSEDRPWIQPTRLGSVLNTVIPRADASDLTRRAAQSSWLTGVRTPDVTFVQELRDQVSGLDEVVANTGALTAEPLRDTLELLSAQWRSRLPALTAAQRRQRDRVRQLTGEVAVLPATLTFLRNSGDVRVTVSNDLDQAITGARLEVTASNPRLVVQRRVSEPLGTVEPGTRVGVEVPVVARAGGDVVLRAQLIAPSGRPVGQAQDIPVRVQPTDEWLLAVGGGLAGLVLVIGVVRSVRRPRRRPTDVASRGSPR
ncbi:MAG: DUF6049 family protein [Angustibacter sp.]